MTAPQPNLQPSPDEQMAEYDAWLNWAIGGGALVLAIAVAGTPFPGALGLAVIIFHLQFTHLQQRYFPSFLSGLKALAASYPNDASLQERIRNAVNRYAGWRIFIQKNRPLLIGVYTFAIVFVAGVIHDVRWLADVIRR